MAVKTLENIDALSQFAAEILSVLPQKDSAHVLALSGDLGAGKTTFVQLFADHLMVTEHVTSPTFVLMRSYETHDDTIKKLIHIDAYRIEDEKEANVLRLRELVREPQTLICIEWPERIPTHIPEDALRINFTIIDKETREVTYDS